MGNKFFVIWLNDNLVVKTPLKKWWCTNRGQSSAITHQLYFKLLADGWKSEVHGNEVLLFSADVQNGEVDDSNSLKKPNANQLEISTISFNKLEDAEKISKCFSDFIKAYNRLKENGILRNQKDITGQLGEWVASKVYDAKISENGINRDWDLEDAEGKHYQVKSHAKSETTSAKWTRVNYSPTAKIDFIIIVVFDQNYVLNYLYKVPFKIALCITKDKFTLNWSQIHKFKVQNLSAILKEKEIGFMKVNEPQD